MDANDAATLALLAAGGIQPIPADSGAGPVWRPLARGQDGGRLAGPETLYDYYINAVFDPDQALRANPNLVNEIHAHPDVEAAMDKRGTTVSQFDETIEANPEGPDKKIAEEIASYVRRVWMAMPNRIHLYWEMVYYATLMGGIGHDWVWHREATGLQRPVKFWLIDKSRFVFDRIGNMALRTRTTPVWGSYVAAEQVDQYITRASAIPQGRITYHWFRRRGGQWEQPDLEGYQFFGVGLDIPLGAIVTYGFFALRFWMRYIEKFGIPPYKLFHPGNMALTPQVKATAEQIRFESVIALPQTLQAGASATRMWDIEPLAIPTAQFNWFQDFSKWVAEKVNLICLSQADASGGGEGRTGEGYSGHVSRYDSGPSLVYKSDAKKVCETLDSQIIAPIALNRFQNLPPEYWPKLKLQAKEERDRVQEMEVAEKTASMVPLAEDEVYERSGFRKPEPGEKTIGGQAPEADPFNPNPLPPMGMPGAQGAPKPGKMVPGFGGGKPQSPAEGAPPKSAIGQGSAAGGNAVGEKPNKGLKQRTIDRRETSGPR